MRLQRLDDVEHLPSFRRKWASLPQEDQAVIRLAFAELQRDPSIAEHMSRLVEIHLVLVGYVLFTFCEVLGTGAMVVIDALVLPAIDASA
jgi:hypothetical protein